MNPDSNRELNTHSSPTACAARLGVWGEWGRWSAPIRDSDIRRWALAVYWPAMPPRRFWDEAYARTTRWGGIVAPDEFNPFAWPAFDAPADQTNRTGVPTPRQLGDG